MAEKKCQVRPKTADPWAYTETVKDHFLNPKNFIMGDETKWQADGEGLVGNPVCGDQMLVKIRVKDNKITDIGWKTYGCASAIASTSALSEIAKGKTLEEADHITAKEICDYLTVEFQFKDLLFEYKNDCLCALKISMNIDDAIDLGEKLVDDINGILKDDTKKVYIGISTRGIRIVSGERLLKEADEAVIHAMEDDTCPVVGFRADAVKYRKFIESN